MDLGIKGRTALVVGAGRGIGRATALALAAEGARVGVLSRTRSEVDEVVSLITSRGGSAVSLIADVTRDVEVDAALDTLGPCTLLVYGASVVFVPKRLQSVEEAELRQAFEVDLISAARLCQRVLPGMVREGHGRIVALSSLAALGGVPGGAVYAAAKAGLSGLCRGIAADYGKKGITAVAAIIGFANTERFRERLQDDPGLLEKRPASTALGQVASPEELAEAITLLCSRQAALLTGSDVMLASGLQLHGGVFG